MVDLLYWLAAATVGAAPAAPPVTPAGAAQAPTNVSAGAYRPGTLSTDLARSSTPHLAAQTAGPSGNAPPGALSRGRGGAQGSRGTVQASPLCTPSALTQRLLARDVATGVLLPPAWRPYKLSREELRAAALAGKHPRKLGAGSGPLHVMHAGGEPV